MAMERLVQLMQEQLTLQREKLAAQEGQYQKQLDEQHRQMKKLVDKLASASRRGAMSTNFPHLSFEAFDPSVELWTDCEKRFLTILGVHTIPEEKKAHVILTNQSPVTYKLLSNLGSQQAPPKNVNLLTLKEISDYMIQQFHPKRFIVRERFKFWSNMGRKPGKQSKS